MKILQQTLRGLQFWGYLALTVLLAGWLTASVQAIRIKDISSLEGFRKNPLIGYGLVVGLDGTGDGKKSLFTIQSLSSMLEKMGITVNPKVLQVKNVAAVMLTAELPPFSRVGSRIDVQVSSIGDASNLQGGILLFTPLKGANGNIYATAQGAVSTGGFISGGAGAGVQKNFPTVGRIVNGAVIEREIASDFASKESLRLTLHHPDFTTVSRVAEAINGAVLSPVARTPDAGTVDIKVPEKYQGNVVQFATLIEGLNITPDNTAKVVINERTGTVVMGENVRVSTLAVAHGNLSVQIKENAQVSQPLPFSQGETVVTPDTNVTVEEGNGKLMLLESGVSIRELVKALNLLGVTPRDLITIFQAIKAAGALQAELELI